jgi:SAM-dependent methyltransferase
MAETVGGCRICGAFAWTTLFEGSIRQGRFGSLTPEARRVLRCGGCGSGFLDARAAVDYESDAYRELVDGDASVASFHAIHDAEQADKLRLLGSGRVRGKLVADIGCGAGSFLDLVSGLAAGTLGIEPTRAYHDTLRAKGHAVHAYCSDAAGDWRGKVDLAVCFSVIEHVDDPVQLLQDVRTLLRPGGELLLSTPNLRDWLLELLPTEYGAFFYRTVHTWYFDSASLTALAAAAGYSGCEVRSVHRFDLSNALLWLRDRRPSGLATVPVDPAVDAAFVRWLENEGRADYLYATLRP